MSTAQKVSTFLMFIGNAEEAINFYAGILDDMQIVSIERYDESAPGMSGKVKLAELLISGQRFKFIDSPPVHAFTFTPSVSIFISSTSKEAVARYYERLSAGGQVLMPLAEYPFSRKYGWVADRYGVSWQLSFRAG